MEEIVKEMLSNTSVNNALLIAFIMILADLLTGFVKAFYNKDFKSSIAKKGLWGKAEWIIILMVGYSCYILLNFSAVVYAMILACVITEFMSILENANACGIDVNIMKYLQDYIPHNSSK